MTARLCYRPICAASAAISSTAACAGARPTLRFKLTLAEEVSCAEKPARAWRCDIRPAPPARRASADEWREMAGVCRIAQTIRALHSEVRWRPSRFVATESRPAYKRPRTPHFHRVERHPTQRRQQPQAGTVMILSQAMALITQNLWHLLAPRNRAKCYCAYCAATPAAIFSHHERLTHHRSAPYELLHRRDRRAIHLRRCAEANQCAASLRWRA